MASFLVRHWLLLINGIVLLFILPIVLAPVFMNTGNTFLTGIAEIIMAGYHATCHQMPERSLFIFGYSMAVCSRCFAIYVAFLIGGIAFYFVRDRLQPFNIIYYVLFCIPMALDGFTQLFGFRESTNLLRIITGVIFGLGSALYVFPYMQAIFKMEKEESERLKMELERHKPEQNESS
ncbi:hypothetical protein CUJ83_05530 [Methanocella sp. CWC-04]|uniref:DUF2085 domain-containing protein n=2 Tax=Methanooceanicella nereidis TaxID=2052831 RepID=A0AAP2RE97_9EURY|nr:hypothetical protein [Methanocella sp. CWC-04]